MNELREKWMPFIEYYTRNGYSESKITQLIEMLEAKKDKFVKKSYFDKAIFNGIIAEWKRKRI